MPNFDNSEALSYGYMMLLLYFGVGVFIWFCWSYAFNIILGTTINPMVADGTLSLQTTHAIGWSVDVLRYAPPLILLLGFIYGINRAIFKSGGG